MRADERTTGYPRVLHLEDDDADAELIRRTLKAEWPQCSIRVVQTREDFTAALAEEGLNLILSDFSMPKFDGLSALSLARRHASSVPFIFMSGTIGEENAVRALHQGAADYVIKDRPGRFVAAVRRALSDSEAQSLQRAAEASLRASEARFMQLAQQSADVIWFFSCEAMRRTYVSPAFERVWGLSAAAVYADSEVWERAIHPGDRARVRAAFEACAKGLSPDFEIEYRIKAADGQERWISDNGSVIRGRSGGADGICGIAKDITRLKGAERRAQERAELLNKARDAIIVVDLDRRILFWNDGAERAFACTVLEAMGMDALQLFGAEAFSRIESALLPASKGEWSGILRLNRQGAVLILDCRVTVVRDEAGRPESYLIFGSDITERLSFEQQLLRTQRIESIGLLAGGIAHDLNNALSPILMGVQLLRNGMSDTEQQRLLKVMDSSARHGAALVRQVLAFSRGVEGERNPIHVEPTIREVVGLMRETLPRSIGISFELAPTLAMVESNTTHLSQILVNLCVNGRDAMPEGGNLIVAARNVEVSPDQARANQGAAAGPHVLISVADNGSGIPPEVLDRIFDPFFTTKEPGKGTGLGLSTVMGIVRSHRGFIEVQTQPGEGTRFNLYFPACGKTQAAAPAAPEPLQDRGGGECILVVDDEENILNVCRVVLDSMGYRTMCETKGATAIETFRMHHKEIGIVITDMMMPEMQGRELIRRVREINPDVRVVAMSGVPPAGTGLIEEPGRTFFLSKPMNAAQLLAVVQKALAPL